jgi:DNA-binding winged helix-turn-helix (wHTH) protein
LFDGFRFDRRSGVLSRRDERGAHVAMAIGSRALDILGVLVERPGELLSRNEIIDAVWPGTAVEDGNLNVQVAALRRVLDQDRVGSSCIQTVRGAGTGSSRRSHDRMPGIPKEVCACRHAFRLSCCRLQI